MSFYKHYISTETGSVYRLRDGYLWYIPINADNTYSEAEGWALVEEKAMENEPLGDPEYYANNPDKRWRTLGDVYAEVRKALA